MHAIFYNIIITYRKLTYAMDSTYFERRLHIDT